MTRSRWLRFNLRAVLIVLTLACLGVWWFLARPHEFRQRQIVAGRRQIHHRDHFWLEACFDETVREHLVTILGDSRLSHWGRVDWLLAPDPETIISYGADEALIVWNRHDGSIRHGFFDAAFALHAPDAGVILFGDSDGKVRSWSIADDRIGPLQMQIPAIASAISRDGKYLLLGSYPEWTVWDCEARREHLTIAPPKSEQAVDLIQLGAELEVSPQQTIVAAATKSILEYDLRTGEQLATVDVPELDEGSWGQIFDLEFTSDGKTLFVVDAGGRVMSFDWKAKGFSRTVFQGASSIHAIVVDSDTRHLSVAHSSGVLRIPYGSDGHADAQVVFGGGASALTRPNARAVGTRDGRIVVLRQRSPVRLEGGPRVDATRFAYSPSGDKIASASRDGQIVVRETAGWQKSTAWHAHEGKIRFMNWSPNASQLITSGEDNTVVVWDPRTGDERESFRAGGSTANFTPAVSRDGQMLATRGRAFAVLINDLAAGKELYGVSRKELAVRGDMLFSADGTRLFVAGDTAAVQVWDLNAEKIAAMMGVRAAMHVKLALNGEGDVLYALMANVVQAFDTKTNVSLWTAAVTGTRNFSLAIHPSQALLAVGGSDGTVVLIDATNGTVLRRLRMGPTRGEILQVGFSPDGQLLTASMSNGAVVVMRVPQGL